MAGDSTPTAMPPRAAPPAFSSNRATYSQRQVTQEQLRATQEELATKIRELQIYEANYLQLKKDVGRWKKKFEYIFRENELLSLETAKLDGSHKQIAFLQQEIKFKEEEGEALRGLVAALEASNKKARASRLDTAARQNGRRESAAVPLAAAALGGDASAVESEALALLKKERAADKERFQAELAALKSENSLLLKDLDRRESALQLSEDKLTMHKMRITSLESSLASEQEKQMKQMRDKQDVIADLEEQIQQLQRRRRSSAVAQEEAAAMAVGSGNRDGNSDKDRDVGFGPSHRLSHMSERAEGEEADGSDEEPDTPPGTPPPISAGSLLPPSEDPLADAVIKDWTDDKRIRALATTDVDWSRLDAFLMRLPFEAKEGATRILRHALDPSQADASGSDPISESQLLVRAVSNESKREWQEFIVPLLKAHKHMRVTYATLQRRTLVTDVRLTLEPRANEFTGGLAVGEKRFGRDHSFYGPSLEDVAKLVLHAARTLTKEKKALYVSKPADGEGQALGSDAAEYAGSTGQTTPTSTSSTTNSDPADGSESGTPTTTTAAPKATGWLVPSGLKMMVKGAKQRVARMNQAKFVHEGSTCQICNVSPIVGQRYACATCVGFDLCENCYSLGGHGLENSDEMFFRVQELVLARCTRLVDELDLLELLRFEICRSNLRKFSFCLNWLADIMTGKTSQQLQARALEIPGIRRDVRKQFVPHLLRLCSDREDLEVKTEWELESDNSAEVKSVGASGASGHSRGSLNEGDGRFLETLRIWVADQYRTTSPFVERSLLKFREGMPDEDESPSDGSDPSDDEGAVQQEALDQFPTAAELPPPRQRAMTAAPRVGAGASSRAGFAEKNRLMSQEF